MKPVKMVWLSWFSINLVWLLSHNNFFLLTAGATVIDSFIPSFILSKRDFIIFLSEHAKKLRTRRLPVSTTRSRMTSAGASAPSSSEEHHAMIRIYKPIVGLVIPKSWNRMIVTAPKQNAKRSFVLHLMRPLVHLVKNWRWDKDIQYGFFFLLSVTFHDGITQKAIMKTQFCKKKPSKDDSFEFDN